MVVKFVPVMVMAAPIAPLVGVKLSRVGVARTVKDPALVPVSTPTVTEIVPVEAPVGTVVVIDVVVEAVTTDGIPLKFTVLSPGVELKFVPVIITVVLSAPLVGLKLSTVGVCAQLTNVIIEKNKMVQILILNLFSFLFKIFY